MTERYDVVVIGGGPGGYVAAIRCAQLGRRTACVDSRATLGGTCLNIGCIPSKALLQSSEKFAEARSALGERGVALDGVRLDLGRMMARKDQVVATLTRGVEFLFRKNRIDWVKGNARIVAPGRIIVTTPDSEPREIEAAAISGWSLGRYGGGSAPKSPSLNCSTTSSRRWIASWPAHCNAPSRDRVSPFVSAPGLPGSRSAMARCGSRLRAVSNRSWRMRCWSRPGGAPLRGALGSMNWGSPAMGRAGSWSMTDLPPTFPASLRSAT